LLRAIHEPEIADLYSALAHSRRGSTYNILAEAGIATVLLANLDLDPHLIIQVTESIALWIAAIVAVASFKRRRREQRIAKLTELMRQGREAGHISVMQEATKDPLSVLRSRDDLEKASSAFHFLCDTVRLVPYPDVWLSVLAHNEQEIVLRFMQLAAAPVALILVREYRR
jgi:hypothetical protein